MNVNKEKEEKERGKNKKTNKERCKGTFQNHMRLCHLIFACLLCEFNKTHHWKFFFCFFFVCFWLSLSKVSEKTYLILQQSCGDRFKKTFNDPLLASHRTVTDTTERGKVVLFISFRGLKKHSPLVMRRKWMLLFFTDDSRNVAEINVQTAEREV